MKHSMQTLHRDRFLCFLSQGDAPFHLKASTRVPTFALAFATHFQPPASTTPNKQGKAPVAVYAIHSRNRQNRALTGIWAVRKTLWQYPHLLADIFGTPEHPEFPALTAQESWPLEAHEAFHSPDPPSPYEVACAVLGAENAYSHPRAPEERREYSTLLWWLLGFRVPTLAFHAKSSEQAVNNQIAKAVANLMQNRAFRIWALGINPYRIATSRPQRIIAKKLLAQESYRHEHDNYRTDTDKLFRNPLINAHYNARTLPNDFVRPLHNPGMVWETQAGKQYWLEENLHADRARRTQTGIWYKSIKKWQLQPHVLDNDERICGGTNRFTALQKGEPCPRLPPQSPCP